MKDYKPVNQSEKSEINEKKKEVSKKCNKKMCCGITSLSFVVLILSCIVAVKAFYPLHASCKIDYKFTNQQCENVKHTLVEQINKWNHTKCGKGDQVHQRCRYKLTSEDADEIKATHTTPLMLYVDDLNFDFNQDKSSCEVKAFSTSQLWYAFLDFGTNYCNLHNLVVGSNLQNYTEDTYNSRCTQYTCANCTRF